MGHGHIGHIDVCSPSTPGSSELQRPMLVVERNGRRRCRWLPTAALVLVTTPDTQSSCKFVLGDVPDGRFQFPMRLLERGEKAKDARDCTVYLAGAVAWNGVGSPFWQSHGNKEIDQVELSESKFNRRKLRLVGIQKGSGAWNTLHHPMELAFLSRGSRLLG